MIITGAFRSIIVKLAYQSGLEAPLTVTLLYLLGQSFSLIVYIIQTRVITPHYKGKGAYHTNNNNKEKDYNIGHGGTDEFPLESYVEMGRSSDNEHGASPYYNNNNSNMGDDDGDNNISKLQSSTTLTKPTVGGHFPIPEHSTYAKDRYIRQVTPIPVHGCPSTFSHQSLNTSGGVISAVGSTHGLTIQSEERIRWMNYIPWYMKPAIPAVFNLLNSALRWASLLYIDASVSEMLISGLELTLSVVAARVFRGRMVAKSRWMGVAIVAVGVIVIERANNSRHPEAEEYAADDDINNDDNHHSTAHTKAEVTIGVILIVLQSVLSVLQDIGEEIFMQADRFPATMMLGMEGLYGFCIGLIIYITLGEYLRIEDIDSTMSMLRDNAKLCWWVVGLPFLFLITGIFNIKATEVTSAMTRNVWKNLRTVLVWVIALCLYYFGHNASYGEAWHTPESYYILLGFIVMCKLGSRNSLIAYFVPFAFSKLTFCSFHHTHTTKLLELLYTIGINKSNIVKLIHIIIIIDRYIQPYYHQH